jgi:hypothetical protein
MIFVWVFAGFIAMSFWEAYIEGSNAWAANQVGWKKRITKKFTLTGYHFWLNLMLILFISLPLWVSGWDLELFGILISAGALGLMLEDFMWFVVNPRFPLKHFDSRHVHWYPWFKIGKLEIPKLYVASIIVAVLSYILLWA